MRTPVWVASLCLLSSCVAFATPDPQISVRGSVVGHDGKPMRAALVVLSGQGVASQRHVADQQGSFQFAVAQPGPFTLMVVGVHHRTLFTPVFVDSPRTVELHVRLAATSFRTAMTDLRVVGDFNKFSEESGGVAMQPQPDGTFAATIDWTGETLSYQVQGALNDTSLVCGTQADSFQENRRSPFIENSSSKLLSVVNTGGRPVRLVFDPRQLPRSSAEPEVRFADPTIPAAGIAAIDRDFKIESRRYTAARNEWVAAGHDTSTFKFDNSAQQRRLEQQIADERNPLLREYLTLRYFGLPEAKSNVELARRVFSDIPPASWAWSLIWGGPNNTFLRLASVAQLPAEEERYVAAACETNPHRYTRGAFLYIALMQAYGKKDANTVGRLYTRLMGDFGDTGYAKDAIAMAPNRNIRSGNSVPEFALVSLDDGHTVTPKALAGKTYLLDFWAVWCGPCIGEMKYLHAAHEKFKDHGLEILSVSFDDKPSDVAQFRKTKWPMPWFNAQLPGFDSETAKAFEVVGLPKTVLVDRDGRIVATEGLRGEELEKTLSRVFGATERR